MTNGMKTLVCNNIVMSDEVCATSDNSWRTGKVASLGGRASEFVEMTYGHYSRRILIRGDLLYRLCQFHPMARKHLPSVTTS